MEYYKLVGMASGKVYGVFRAGKGLFERYDREGRFTEKGQWYENPDLGRYLVGLNDDAEKITEDQAKRIIAKWKREDK